MRRLEYLRLLKALLQADAAEQELREPGEGLVQVPPALVELRRWGPTFTPLGFQTEVIDGIAQALLEHSVRGLLALPTGSGKTLTATWVLLDAMKGQGSSVQERPVLAVWLAPQKELLFQAADAVQGAWRSGRGPDSLDVRIVHSGQDFRDPTHPTVLLMTPQMARSIGVGNIGEPTAVVFDEAHHAAADTFAEVWTGLADAETCRLALGISGTPSRTDSRELSDLKSAFHGNLFVPRSLGNNALERLMEQGVLSKPVFRAVPNVPDYARVQGFSDQRTLRGLVTDPDRWRAIVDCIQRDCEGPTVVYAADRPHGQALTKQLRYLGANAEYVDGDTPMGERIGVFERFRDGATRVLVNVALLIEGVDCPAASNVVLTYPVDSEIMVRQMVGRVLRGPKVGGTPNSTVWSVDGVKGALERKLYDGKYIITHWNVKYL